MADGQVIACIEKLLDMAPMTWEQKVQTFLPEKEGGFGMGSVEIRATAAWLGAWEFGLADVAKNTRDASPGLNSRSAGPP